MQIGIIGDTHASVPAISFMLWTMREYGITTVVSVGDFGVYSDQYGTKFADRTASLCKEYGITLYVVPGNHENYRIINELTGDDRSSWAEYRPRVFLVPRGMRWEWDGMSFVALGGAPSVDRTWRVQNDLLRKPDAKNKLWYAEEEITEEDVEYTVAGGYADVMIAHDAPRGVTAVFNAIDGNPMGFAQSDLLYAEDGRDRIDAAFRGVAPSLFFHGHYHVPGVEAIHRPESSGDEKTVVVSLAHELNNKSMAILDTSDHSVEIIDHRSLLARFRNGGAW